MENAITILEFTTKTEEKIEEMVLISKSFNEKEKKDIANYYLATNNTCGNNWLIVPKNTFKFLLEPIFVKAQKNSPLKKKNKFTVIYDNSLINSSINPFNSMPCKILKANMPNRKCHPFTPITYTVQFENGEILRGVLKKELKVFLFF